MNAFRISVIIFAISASLLSALDVHAGAWTLPQGYFYIEWFNKYYTDKRTFDARRDKHIKPNDGKYSEWRSELKLEYGITDNLNFTIYVPYKTGWSKDANGKSHNASIEDTWLGFKYRIFIEPAITSVWLRLKVPGPYDPNDSPQLGRRQFDAEARLLVGKSFKTVRSYIGAELGFRARNEEPANEIPYFLESGINLTDRMMLKLALDGLRGLPGTGNVSEDYLKFTIGPSFSLKGGFGSVYRNEPSSELEIGYGNTFYGKNTGAGQELFTKLTNQF